MTTDQLEYLDELIARDQAAAAALVELDHAMRCVADVRSRAEHVRRELELGPVEVERRRAESASANDGLDAALVRLEHARSAEQAAARQADERERLRACAQVVVEAQDSVHIAEIQATEAAARLQERSTQLTAAAAEGPRVEAAVAQLARSLAATPRLPASVSVVPNGLAATCEWAVEARAALVVARSAEAGEREQVIRQAGELGALVTGAAVPASSMSTLASLIRAASAG